MSEHFILEREGNNPLEFYGRRLADYAWDDDYSGDEGISAVLFETRGGKFVCQKIVRWDIEKGSDGQRIKWKQKLETAVCKIYSEVVNFFGHGIAASIIYRDANIPYSPTELID